MLLDKLRRDSHLGTGHGEGVLAIALVGELHGVAVGVLYGNGIQLVALVRGDGDGHSIALLSGLGRNGHITVFGIGNGHSIAAAAAGAGTAAGRTPPSGKRHGRAGGRCFVNVSFSVADYKLMLYLHYMNLAARRLQETS